MGTQNRLIIFICKRIFAKYGILYSKYVHYMRRSTADTGHSRSGWGGVGDEYSVISFNLDILRVCSMDPEDSIITEFHCTRLGNPQQ